MPNPPTTPRKFKPRLPNRGSKHQTSASLAFDLHYAHLGVIERWDRDRYDRLCVFLTVTRYELASLISWPHAQVPGAIERNDFKGPVALLLTILEAQVMHKFTKDVIQNPFPHGQQTTP